MASMTDPTKPRTDGVQPSLNGADPDRGDKAASPFAGISINFGADETCRSSQMRSRPNIASADSSTPFALERLRVHVGARSGGRRDVGGMPNCETRGSC